MPETGLSKAMYIEPRDTPLGALRRQGKTKVSIVGFCQSSRDGCPYDDPEMAVIGLNRGYIFMKRADVWFEMHSQEIWTNDQRRPGKHLDWLNAFPGPVYMHRRFDDVKNSVPYPLKEIAEFLGGTTVRIGAETKVGAEVASASGKTVWDPQAGEPQSLSDAPYLSSSISYEIALAIYEGFEEIHLYGVDLNTESEYAWQKPGVEYLLGFAAAKGIKIVLPSNCPLLHGTLYGRGFMSARPEVMSYDQLKTRAENLKREIEQVEERLYTLIGAERECGFQNAQMQPGLDHEKMDKRRQQMQQQIMQFKAGILERRGALTETLYWLHQTMEGQEPEEAIAQLKALDHGPEGPLDQFEALTDHEPAVVAAAVADSGFSFSMNGHEAVAVGGVP